MTPLLLALAIAAGTATRYDPGVMQAVVANRTAFGQLDLGVEPEGYVALLDCDLLGRLVWLQAGQRIDGPYAVADCAAAAHRPALEDRGVAVDLSWEVALEWGVIDAPLPGFTVWDVPPAAKTPN